PRPLPSFPYTTLFRSDALQVAGVVLHQPAADAPALFTDQVDHGAAAEIAFHAGHAAREQRGAARGQRLAGAIVDPHPVAAGRLRSEEHTSELQSRENL